MAQLTHYRQVVSNILQQIANRYNRTPTDNIRTYAILDEKNDHYLLLDVGRTHKKRHRSIVVYVRIDNGKIWVEEDWTEDGVATYLVEQGIPKSQIVLGFKPPEIRPFTEFAVA